MACGKVAARFPWPILGYGNAPDIHEKYSIYQKINN